MLGGEPGAAVLDRCRYGAEARVQLLVVPGHVLGEERQLDLGLEIVEDGDVELALAPMAGARLSERPDRAQPLLGPRRERGDILDLLGAFDLL